MKSVGQSHGPIRFFASDVPQFGSRQGMPRKNERVAAMRPGDEPDSARLLVVGIRKSDGNELFPVPIAEFQPTIEIDLESAVPERVDAHACQGEHGARQIRKIRERIAEPKDGPSRIGAPKDRRIWIGFQDPGNVLRGQSVGHASSLVGFGVDPRCPVGSTQHRGGLFVPDDHVLAWIERQSPPEFHR